jgi:hypothetical protein
MNPVLDMTRTGVPQHGAGDVGLSGSVSQVSPGVEAGIDTGERLMALGGAAGPEGLLGYSTTGNLASGSLLVSHRYGR